REQVAKQEDLLIDTTLTRAARYLENVPDVHKAELVAELERLRNRGSAAAAAPAAPAAAPTAASSPAPAPAPTRKDDKADEQAVSAFTFTVESAQRGAARDLQAFDSAREKYGPKELDPTETVARQLDWAAKVRAAVEPARAQLTSEPGQA